MANARFLWKNWGVQNGVTITSSGDATGYAAAAALASPDRTNIWRSTTTTGNQNVDFDFTALGAKTITAIGAVNYKLHASGGTLTAQYSTGGAFTTFATFTIPSPNRTNVVYVFGSQAGVTKVRFLFTNVGTVSDYVELGVGFIVDTGSDFTPVGHLVNQRGFTPVDPSPIQYSVGQQRRAYRRPQHLELEAVFTALRAADVATLTDTIYSAVGTADPMIFVLSTAVADEAVYGVMPASIPFGGLNGGQKSVSFTIEELA
jgi:hypothetical protein